MNELIYWIWLSLATTPDAPTFPKLIEAFGDAKQIYDADIHLISKYIGARSSDRARLEDKDLTKAKEIFAYCQKFDIGIVAYPDERFPVSLKEIATPPVLLYYRGTFPDFNKKFALAIVGTRSLSDYGRSAAFVAGYEMSMSGAIIVSGMAMGIDGVAHAGALAADGTTVAVIGSGINICYPEGHKNLARAIVKQGCVISEFQPGTKPSKFTFPKRNRLISGLCAATLVIEGKERSGSLITARYAKEQGRKVYALPGNVGAKNSEATNLLLKNGAKLYTCSDDIIRDFENIYPGELNPFLLPEKFNLNVLDSLRRYSVIAVAPSDDIFMPPRQNKKPVSAPKIPDILPIAFEENHQEESNTPPSSFDKDALAVYKMIPTEGECDIESLVSSGKTLRSVMQCLFKLEMGQFIVMCPGERVKRKS